MNKSVLLVPDTQGHSEFIDGVEHRELRRTANDELKVAVTAPYGPASIGSGQLIVGAPGTRVTFPNQACKAVSIAAKLANTGKIYLGDYLVTAANGRILSPGDTIDLAILNLQLLNIDAQVAGEGVSYFWVG